MEMGTYEFIEWIYQHYGWPGCVVFLLALLAILALLLYLASRLPESKEVIVWSICSSCTYKRKKSNGFVLTCPQYEKPRWNQLKSPPCPIVNDNDCKIIPNLSNPAVFNREDIPANRD